MLGIMNAVFHVATLDIDVKPSSYQRERVLRRSEALRLEREERDLMRHLHYRALM